MDYQLFAKQDTARPIAKAAFADDFAAECWARDWARSNGSGADYLIKRADGALSAQLFRTHAGQWYVMRQ